MSFFVGTFEFSMDAKGRVNVPSRFRDELPAGDKQLAIFKGLDGCLFVYPRGEADVLTRNLRNPRFLSEPAARRFKRQMLDGASRETPDAQGRILLNDKQRAHAGLEKNVVFFGNDERFEIWSPERYEAQLNADGDGESFDEQASRFFGADLPPLKES